MRRLTAFFLLSFVKIFSSIFYRGQFVWISPTPNDPWRKARLIVFLNHTSLFEPLFLQHLTFSYLWHLSAHLNVPGADVTLDRPIVGLFWKLMIPGIASITRRKDNSWTNYMSSIRHDSMIVIAAEGRMKRLDGKDKFGKPMTVRGGVADIIESLDQGGMILCLSGGLHHVQAPGQHFPRLFKTIKLNMVYIDIGSYKSKFSENLRERKIQIVQDLQARLEKDCPN
jgi:hypothetical protein